MSAWPIPDEVVERVAEFMYRCARQFFLDAAPLWADLTPHLQQRWIDHAECVIYEHRLVQLPEPVGWEYEIIDHYNGGPLRWDGPTDRGAAEEQVETPLFSTTGRIRPVYRIPGQPITVGEEGRDG